MRERPLHYAAIAGCANAVQVGHLGHSGTTPGPKNNISGGLVGFKYCLTFQVDVGERWTNYLDRLLQMADVYDL